MPRKSATTKDAAEKSRTNGGAKPRRRDIEVIDVAANIFYERGYASATVQDVADALGMLKGSLYYYIDSKQDLLYRLMVDIHDGVDQMLAEVKDAPDLSAADRLELYVRRAVEYNARNLKKISVYYHDIDQLTGPLQKEILARRRAHDDYVTKLIRQAQADGDVDPDLDAKLLSNCVFATIIWMYRWYKPGRGVSVEQLTDTSARFVRYGLRGAPTPAAARR
jgi:TetR/AcrR family transcriptional regulator, cholesterol catabolism regulator